MIKKIKSFFLHDLIKITSWSGISYFIKTVSQFIISKVLAITIGPSGLAVLGQISNISSIIQSVGSAGISMGVTKYVAENADNEAEQRKVINNAFKLVFCASAVTGLFILISFKFINSYFLGGGNYNIIILVAGLTVLLYSANNTVIAIINGFKFYRLYIFINILNSIFNLIFVLIAIKFWGFQGALLSVVLAPAILFFISYFFVYKNDWFSFKFLFIKFDPEILKKLSSFSLMSINNAIVGAIGQIVLRNIIIKNISITEAGLWDAMTKVSNGYMILITTSIQVYFLPTLASIANPKLVWKELIKANKMILPAIIILLIAVFIFRRPIIMLLFTKEFLPLADYFKYQLIGDVIKISSWIFAYIMYAKAMTKRLILTDNIFTLTYILLAYLLVSQIHLKGIFIAYICNSSIYLIFIFFFIRKRLLSPAS